MGDELRKANLKIWLLLRKRKKGGRKTDISSSKIGFILMIKIKPLLFLSCPNSDGDDSRAPALCLICGEMLCSQSYCCQTEVEGDKVGACAAHAQKCGAGVGVFLRVRECQILLMTNKNKGCFYSPPYLDAYGETDQGLRWDHHLVTPSIVKSVRFLTFILAKFKICSKLQNLLQKLFKIVWKTLSLS